MKGTAGRGPAEDAPSNVEAASASHNGFREGNFMKKSYQSR
jgi:hypothetical protein